MHRSEFRSLLEAVTLQQADERPAIIYLEADCRPLVVSRWEFRQQVLAYAAGLNRLGIQARDLVIIAHTQTWKASLLFGGRWPAEQSPPCSRH